MVGVDFEEQVRPSRTFIRGARSETHSDVAGFGFGPAVGDRQQKRLAHGVAVARPLGAINDDENVRSRDSGPEGARDQRARRLIARTAKKVEITYVRITVVNLMVTEARK